MSTRWYPLYHRGNPQLRVFLSNFWLKLVEPSVSQPPNVVQFHCSMGMTRYDVKNYLKEIYGVKVVNVRTRIKMGEIRRDPGYVIKDDDIKIAYAVLPLGETFQFPNVFENEDRKKELDEEKEIIDGHKKQYQKYLEANSRADRAHLPGWYSI